MATIRVLMPFRYYDYSRNREVDVTQGIYDVEARPAMRRAADGSLPNLYWLIRDGEQYGSFSRRDWEQFLANGTIVT